jgi:hypothetical protein
MNLFFLFFIFLKLLKFSNKQMANGSYLVPFMMTPSMGITMAPFLGH